MTKKLNNTLMSDCEKTALRLAYLIKTCRNIGHYPFNDADKKYALEENGEQLFFGSSPLEVIDKGIAEHQRNLVSDFSKKKNQNSRNHCEKITQQLQ